MKILVTGGAGFIGSHLAGALLVAGHKVTVMDSLVGGRRHSVPATAEFLFLDVNAPAAAAWVAEQRPDAIFHLAAQVDVRKSVKDPIADAEVNAMGTLRLMAAAAGNGVRAFILSSSGGAIYGSQNVFPADEKHPCQPESAYGVSKLCAENYAELYQRTSPMRTVSLRYSNVYGPGQNPHAEAGVVAILIRTMLEGAKPTLYGAGEQTRDFVYVMDVVRANVLALRSEHACGPINIGSGTETSIRALCTAIMSKIGYTGTLETGPLRPGEQLRSSVANEHACAILDWSPETGLSAGLDETISWFLGQPDSLVREARGEKNGIRAVTLD